MQSVAEVGVARSNSGPLSASSIDAPGANAVQLPPGTYMYNMQVAYEPFIAQFNSKEP